MDKPFDLYAPYPRPGKKPLTGAAAMNTRLKKDYGGANGLSAAMLEAGFRLGGLIAWRKKTRGE